MKPNRITHRARLLRGSLGIGALLLSLTTACSSSSSDTSNSVTDDNGIGISNIAPAANDATTFTSPFDATPDPDGKNIYFTALTLDGLPGVFTVSAAGGAVSALVTGDPLAAPFGIAISEDGSTLYIADANADDATGDDDEGAILTMPVGGGTPTILAGTSGMHPRGLEIVGNQLYFTGIQNGLPGVFTAALGGGAVTQVGTSTLFSDPSGIAVTSTGDVYVMDSTPDTAAGSAVVKIDSQGTVSIFKDGLSVGHPAGIALVSDESAILVSGLDPAAGTDVVYRVELADASSKTFTSVIGTFQESAGLHRAKNSDTFAWADSRANASGTVYVLTK